MSFRLRFRVAVSAVVATILLLTGCATGSEATGGSSPAESQATPLPDEEIETVNEAQVSPIFDALGFDPADRQTARTEFTTNAEELVRQCMNDAGFDYVPNLPSARPSVSQLWQLQDTIGADQFIAEYGYGISTLLEADFKEEGVLAFVELLLGPPPTEARSPGEQAAYELALSGNTVQGMTAAEAQSEGAGNFGGEEGSCRNIGYSTADNALGDKFDGLFTLLGDEYDALFEQFDNDPRVREMNAAWQTCMAEAGYSFENAQEAVEDITADADDIRNGFQTSPEALAIFAAAGQANLATMNADDRFGFLEAQGAFQGFSLVPSLQSDLDALIQRELSIAARDSECGDPELVAAVLSEYEQAFVEQHAEQLQLIASGEA